MVKLNIRFIYVEPKEERKEVFKMMEYNVIADEL